MFVENGEETIVHFRRGAEEVQISVDDESYARMLNKGYEVISELSHFTRLPLEQFDASFPQDLRSH